MTARLQLGWHDDRVELTAMARAYPGGLWTFDDNWLLVELTVSGLLAWRFQAFLRCEDFVSFAAELDQFRAGQRQRAGFWPRDPWLGCRVERVAGRIQLQVMLHENGSHRHREFTSSVTDLELTQLCDQLRSWLEQFPRRTRAVS